MPDRAHVFGIFGLAAMSECMYAGSNNISVEYKISLRQHSNQDLPCAVQTAGAEGAPAGKHSAYQETRPRMLY